MSFTKSTSAIILSFIAGIALMWGVQHLIVMEAPSRFAEIKAEVSSIPTPEGWYARGVEALPTDPVSSKQGADVTFGNQPLDTHGNLKASIITIGGNSLNGMTTDQWIVSHYLGTLPSLFSATSTGKTWGVVNDRLIFGSVDKVPAGGHILSYYLFTGGLVYTFMLSPSPFVSDYLVRDKNLVNSPDAELLRNMVKQFADNLPSESGK
jgi:hypothetical protein